MLSVEVKYALQMCDSSCERESERSDMTMLPCTMSLSSVAAAAMHDAPDSTKTHPLLML